MIQARLETLEQAASRRLSPRRKLKLGSNLLGHGDNVVIHDLSATGVLLQTTATLAPFDDLDVDLPDIGPTQAFVVWHSGEYFGCEFARPIPRAAISAALLRSPIGPRPNEAEERSPLLLEDEARPEKLSLPMRMRVILGTSIVLWAIILWALGLL